MSINKKSMILGLIIFSIILFDVFMGFYWPKNHYSSFWVHSSILAGILHLYFLVSVISKQNFGFRYAAGASILIYLLYSFEFLLGVIFESFDFETLVLFVMCVTSALLTFKIQDSLDGS